MKKKLKPLCATNNGFTFLEILMAMTVIALAATCSYEALRGGVMRLTSLQEKTEQSMNLKIALTLLSKDLRCAFVDADFPETRFVAHRGPEGIELEFDRMKSGEEPKPERVRYFLEDNDGGQDLWKETENHRVLLYRNINDFKLQFFDGQTWHDDWGWNPTENKPLNGIRGLPAVVSIEIGHTKVLTPVMTPFLNRHVEM